MKKSVKIILGIIGIIGVGVAIFFLFIKDKLTSSTSTKPITGNAATGDLTTITSRINSLETDLKNRISNIQTNTNILGATILTGEGSPASSLGSNKDLYFDTTNGYTFVKINGIWQYLANGINDGSSDEYNAEEASFLRPASAGAVAQVRDLVYSLIQLKTNPNITILDGVDYEGSQGVAEVDIPITDFGVYGQEYIPPIYSVINSALMLTIRLTGSQNTVLFTGQVFPNSLLVPRKVDSEWTYVLV